MVVFLFDTSTPGKVSKLPSDSLTSIQAFFDSGMTFITETQSAETHSNNNFNSNYPYLEDLLEKLDEIGYRTKVKSLFPNAQQQCGSVGGSCVDSELVMSNHTADALLNEWVDFLEQWSTDAEGLSVCYVFHVSSQMRLQPSGALLMDWLVGVVIESLDRLELDESTILFLYLQDHAKLKQFPHQEDTFKGFLTHNHRQPANSYSIPGAVRWLGGLSEGVFKEANLIPQSIAKTIYSLTGLEPPVEIDASRVPDLFLNVLDYEDIEVVEDFLTPEECDYFIQQTWPSTKPEHKSKITDFWNPARDWVYRQNDEKVKLISERISNFTDFPVVNMEDLQVAYFRDGQQTQARYEACVSPTEYCISDRERGGLRALSVFIWLSDNFKGGELEFPARGRRFSPKKGTALFVGNLDSHEQAHIGSFYRDLAVTEGKKYLGYVFVRQRAFAYPVAPDPPPYVSTANMTEMAEYALNSHHGPVVTGTLPCDALCTTNETDGDYEITYYDNFLTDEECAYLIELGKPSLVRSSVMGDEAIIDSRTSRNTFIFRSDPVVMTIAERIAGIVHMPIQNQEAMQVVHYMKRQEYKAHYDACVADHVSCYEDRKRGGFRYVTMFLYLNDDFTGGGTGFPSMNCISQAKKKRGVVFYNLNKENSTSHPFSFHSGEPVLDGEKFGANVWIRLEPFD